MTTNTTTPAITLYGIRNCDTVKKARQWLDGRGAAYRFHDFKTQGVPQERLDAWIAGVGWQTLVNRQGTTWRRLDEAARDAVTDAPAARVLMQDNPSVIKRPVVDWSAAGPETTTTVGFDAGDWERRLG